MVVVVVLVVLVVLVVVAVVVVLVVLVVVVVVVVVLTLTDWSTPLPEDYTQVRATCDPARYHAICDLRHRKPRLGGTPANVHVCHFAYTFLVGSIRKVTRGNTAAVVYIMFAWCHVRYHVSSSSTMFFECSRVLIYESHLPTQQVTLPWK